MFYLKNWIRVLREIDNLQIFELCQKLEELNLDDDNTPSTEMVSSGGRLSSTEMVSSTGIVSSTEMVSSRGRFSSPEMVSSTNSGSFLRSLHRWGTSIWSRSINERLRAPFLEVPHPFLDLDSSSLSSSIVESYNKIRMGFGYRFVPGQVEFLLQELEIPESFDRLSFLSSSLGLVYYKSLLTYNSMLEYSSSGTGLRGLVMMDATLSKVLVEVLSYYDGMYGRFLINVCLGIGCIVWYAFVPGRGDQMPVGGPFAPFTSYTQFLDTTHSEPGFHRIGFVEGKDVSSSVMSVFENENPFAEITIPASGPALRSVSLGLMISFFLTVGILPGSGNQDISKLI